jgi:glucosyl-dolichyl phosphate glucuronosyltransferase
MRVTVILCTYNRCQTLRKALESVAASEVPSDVTWDVLVVDNNSTDQTRTVITDFCSRYPELFRYAFEPRPGKSNALNSGVQLARGEILAFMDDDVIVEPAWLANLLAVFADESWAGAGGPILPPADFIRPPWLPPAAKHLLAPFAHFNPLPNPGELAEAPWGANMAFRKTMFERYGGFRTDLGVGPGSRIPNEDTEFGRRLLAGGERFFFVPSAIVYHPVSAERLKQGYHLTWWFGQGQADVRELGIPRGRGIFGIPLHLFGSVAVLSLRWLLALGPSNRFGFKRSLWYTFGAIKECFHQSSRPAQSHARAPEPSQR